MKLKLKINNTFDSNVEFIGISTYLKDYQISLFINKVLNLKLKKIDNLNINYNKQDLSFSLYYYEDNDNLREYFLISNRSIDNGLYMLPLHKQTDFFMIIQSSVKKIKPEISKIIENIRIIKNVNLAYIINISHIRNFHSFLLNELELHLNYIKAKNKLNY
ncbi:MAG TPA: IPExxxVDY family protein [Bacteroidales bacterium]|nr:IPExxxVDY family protein [Bacteroidales bacterium]